MTGGRFALLIATSNYQDQKFRQLRAPAQDVEALRGVLEDPAIGAFEVKTLVDAEHWAVMSELEGFFLERKPDDFCLLYFSCHGVKDVTGHLHFATTTTLFSRLAATGISSSWVNERLERSRARRSVVLLDCCYSGAFARGFSPRSGEAVAVVEGLDGRGRVVITASDAMEYAWEDTELTMETPRPSVFTSALVTGLQTGAADRDGDGIITVDELYDYVHEEVRRETPNQTPTVSVIGAQGDLVVARNPHRSEPAEAEPLPPDLDAALFDQRGWVRRAAVDRLQVLLVGAAPGVAISARRALDRLAQDPEGDVRAAARTALEEDVAAQGPTASGGRRAEVERPAQSEAEPERQPEAGAGPGSEPAKRSEAEEEAQPPGEERPRRDEGDPEPDVAGPEPQPGPAGRRRDLPVWAREALQHPGGMAAAVAVVALVGLGAWQVIPSPVDDGGGTDAQASEEAEEETGGSDGEEEPEGGDETEQPASTTCQDLPIAFERDGDVWTREADGTASNRTEHPAHDRQATWSPERDALVFVSDRTGTNALHLLDLVSGEVRPITDDEHPEGDFDPAWHPDGSRVAFTRKAEDGRRDVFVVALSGPEAGRAVRLTGTPGEDQRPAWSPEGRLVFHSHADGTIDLHTADGDGSDVATLSSEEGYSHFHASWSPDGSEVTFGRKPDGAAPGAGNELYRVGVADQSARPLVEGTATRGWDPHWCPTGGQVVYEDDSTGRSELYVVDLAAGAEPQQLTRDGGRDPAW